MMNLRKATLEDGKTLFDWRNDPLTREASHNTGELSLAAHMAWLTTSLENPNRTLLIAEDNGLQLGTVRMDHGKDSTELSWTVAPSARGRGVAKQMVTKAAETCTVAICAEVKAGNLASAKVAEAAGMALARQEAGILYYYRKANS